MSARDGIVADTAHRILSDLCPPDVVNDAEKGIWPAELWRALEEGGLTLAWLDDRLGGAGAEIADGFDVLKAAGAHAAPVPLAETLMAAWLLGRAGLEAPPGPMTLAPVDAGTALERVGGGVRGTARGVPFARNAEHIAVLADGEVALVAAGDCTIRHGVNLAGEARDDVDFGGVAPVARAPAPSGLDADHLIGVGAAVRSAQIAGAMGRILDQTVGYAMERSQFGRPIGRFQAVQHRLADLAGESAACEAVTDAAGEAVAAGRFDEAATADIAAAKIRTGEAASAGAAIAHQIHGAMGFTYEHTLHHRTRRLWSWRDEFGNEGEWSLRLGRLVAARGGDGLWPFIAGG